jgi:hypothetical protein
MHSFASLTLVAAQLRPASAGGRSPAIELSLSVLTSLVPVAKGGVNQARYRSGHGDDVTGEADKGKCGYHLRSYRSRVIGPAGAAGRNEGAWRASNAEFSTVLPKTGAG